MNINEKQVTLRYLTPSEGMWLTQAEQARMEREQAEYEAQMSNE